MEKNFESGEEELNSEASLSTSSVSLLLHFNVKNIFLENFT